MELSLFVELPAPVSYTHLAGRKLIIQSLIHGTHSQYRGTIQEPVVLYLSLIHIYSSSLIRIIQQVQPDEIYNLAAQSHVKVSFDVPEYKMCIRDRLTLGQITRRTENYHCKFIHFSRVVLISVLRW